MEIDLLNLEPTKISRDLKGKYLLLYGSPKCGKTSFAVQAPKNILLAFEIGYNALPGIMAQPITNWADFRKAVKQLERDNVKERYDTVTVDTVTIAWDKCEEYICAREGKEKLADIPWGQGYDMCKKEFETQLRKLTMIGYGLILIAHEEEKPVSQGSEETMIRPRLAKRAYEIANGIVDIIGYISIEWDGDKSERFLYTRRTQKIFAGSRFQYLPAKIPFGYENLCEAIADAIEQSVGEKKELITDDILLLGEDNTRPFAETMNEAKTIWSNFSTDEQLEQATEAISRVFGYAMRLSAATEAQQSLVEEVIIELKKIQ